jgi:hypothetical protein
VIPNDVVRLAVSGKTVGAERWECSIWFKPDTQRSHVPSTNADANDTLDSMTTGSEWDGLVGGLVCMVGSSGGADTAKLYCYPSGGPTAAAIGSKALTVAGTGSTGTTPLQTAMVATLLTGQAGRSFRGRIYVPAPNAAIGTDHQFTTGVLDAVGEGLQTYLGWIKTSDVLPDSTGLFGSIVSQQRSVATPITDIRIDTKPDVQRRRAKSLTPTTVRSYHVSL